MRNKELVYDVVNFLSCYGIFDCNIEKQDIDNVEEGLKDPAFVERLIGIVMKSGNKVTPLEETKALYSKLNDLRFDLEHKRH